jgi:endonuclease YncB( thermonuclease family)
MITRIVLACIALLASARCSPAQSTRSHTVAHVSDGDSSACRDAARVRPIGLWADDGFERRPEDHRRKRC